MIITALDFDNSTKALEFVELIDPSLTRVKVGKELFTLAGPVLIEQLQQRGFDVFLDLKFHDIPNTVAGALKAAASLGVWMVNVHASGGPRMLDAARSAVPVAQGNAGTRLIAVTVLTSMDHKELGSIGVSNSPQQQVQNLATMTAEHGLDGVVCSAQEVAEIKKCTPEHFLTVTPGVRPASNDVKGDDQKRTMTPVEAVLAGSSYLVVGRPITQAVNPRQTLVDMNQAVEQAIKK